MLCELGKHEKQQYRKNFLHAGSAERASTQKGRPVSEPPGHNLYVLRTFQVWGGSPRLAHVRVSGCGCESSWLPLFVPFRQTLMPICIQDGRPSHGLGTPAGSEDCFWPGTPPVSNSISRAKGIRLGANRYQQYQASAPPSITSVCPVT